jgi:hypothetical protein
MAWRRGWRTGRDGNNFCFVLQKSSTPASQPAGPKSKKTFGNYSPPRAACKPLIRRIFAGQIPDPRTRRQKVKVFWFFSSEKNRIFFCLTKKKQKDF